MGSCWPYGWSCAPPCLRQWLDYCSWPGCTVVGTMQLLMLFQRIRRSCACHQHHQVPLITQCNLLQQRCLRARNAAISSFSFFEMQCWLVSCLWKCWLLVDRNFVIWCIFWNHERSTRGQMTSENVCKLTRC
jgi:hypothetical protein